MIIIIVPKTISLDDTSNNIIYVDDDNIDGPWDGSLDHPYRFIQDAIDISRNGDTVFVFDGIYYENLVLYKSINLLGSDNENTFIDGGRTGHVMKIESNYVTVKNFTVQNSGDTGSGKTGIGINFENYLYTNLNEIHITHCIIKNNQRGVFFNNVSNSSISYSVICNSKYYSIDVGLSSKNITISNCSVYENGEEIGGGWIYDGCINIEPNYNPNSRIDKCYNITIIDCNIHGNIGHGISLTETYNAKILKNTISKNSWDGISIHGIFRNENDSDFLEIQKVEIGYNKICENIKNGIRICNQKNYEFIIHNNSITANNNLNLPFAGVYLQDCIDCSLVLKNNNISSNNFTGVRAIGSPGNCIFENQIYNNKRGGIAMGDESPNNTICNNNVSSNGYGISVSQSGNNDISNNTIARNSEYGLKVVYNSDKNVIKNNFISSNILDGIYLTTSNNTIYGNNISKNRNGIKCYNSSNIFIKNKIATNSNSGIFLHHSDDHYVMGNEVDDNGYANIYLYKSFNNIIINNHLTNSDLFGIFLNYSRDNSITRNNFIGNKIDAFFLTSSLESENVWTENFWQRPRVLPNIIFGIFGRYLTYPWFCFDWNPAKEPYDL